MIIYRSEFFDVVTFCEDTQNGTSAGLSYFSIIPSR
jgi:hypothetical protein